MLSTLRLPGGMYSESDEKTLTPLTEVHFSGFKGPMGVVGEFQKSWPLPATQSEVRRGLAHKIASSAKVRLTLKSFCPFKVQGSDGIQSYIL